MSNVFAPFVRQKTVLLTTYRRDGTPVATPVHMAVEGDHGYFRTYDQAWKVKRIRNNPNVTLRPSTMRGRPTGPPVEATARRLEGQEAAHAGHLLAAKYRVAHGLLVPLAHRARGYTTVHYELRSPDPTEPVRGKGLSI